MISGMRIPEHKVEEVKTTVDIVDVVSDYVRLKRAGANFKGLCPFHDEKTPSFNVNPVIGIYKCFGCGEGGDAISFVEKVEGLGFVEAVRLLAERAGIELPEEGEADPAADENESLLHALRFAARFYFHELTQSEAGREIGLAYFRDRGFSAETIKKFGLGYAPDAWDSLLTAAGEQQVRPEILEKAGLVLPRKQGGGYYDRFRGRVLFPIVSHVGKVLGFGGRILGQDSEQPKYINSPETPVYHKGRVLYGLHQAKQSIRSEEEVVLVEGYTDVISLHQAGVANVVAASGTALTADQVKLLGRYAKRIVLLFDADSAGAAAALRSIDVILQQGLAVYVISLPEKADPDSFVRQFGGEAFRNYARKHRQSFVAFQVEQAKRERRLETPEGQMEAAQSILRSIARVPSEPAYYVMWDGYLRQAAQLLGLPDINLRQQFPDLIRRASTPSPHVAQQTPPPRPHPLDPTPTSAAMKPEEGALIRLMLQHGLAMVEFVLGHMAVEEFTAGPVRETIQHILTHYEAGRIDSGPFTRGDFGQGVQRIATGVLVDRHTASANWQRQHNIRVPAWNEDPYEAAASAMTLLKLDRVNEAIVERQKVLYAAEQSGEDTHPVLEAVQELYRLRGRIERRQFLTDPDAA
jgi:DNA primase